MRELEGGNEEAKRDEKDQVLPFEHGPTANEEEDGHEEVSYDVDRTTAKQLNRQNSENGWDCIAQSNHIGTLGRRQRERTAAFLFHLDQKAIRVDVDCVDACCLSEAVEDEAGPGGSPILPAANGLFECR